MITVVLNEVQGRQGVFLIRDETVLGGWLNERDTSEAPEMRDGYPVMEGADFVAESIKALFSDDAINLVYDPLLPTNHRTRMEKWWAQVKRFDAQVWMKQCTNIQDWTEE